MDRLASAEKSFFFHAGKMEENEVRSESKTLSLALKKRRKKILRTESLPVVSHWMV